MIDRRSKVARDVRHGHNVDALIDGGVVDENVLPNVVVVALLLPPVLEIGDTLLVHDRVLVVVDVGSYPQSFDHPPSRHRLQRLRAHAVW